MAWDEQLAERIRGLLADTPGVREQKMFGGLSFLVDGHMSVGLNGEDMVVRVGPEAYEDALHLPHARKMDFTHRPLRGFVYVAPPGTAEDDSLAEWVEKGLSYAQSLPPKKPKNKGPRRRKRPS